MNTQYECYVEQTGETYTAHCPLLGVIGVGETTEKAMFDLSFQLEQMMLHHKVDGTEPRWQRQHWFQLTQDEAEYLNPPPDDDDVDFDEWLEMGYVPRPQTKLGWFMHHLWHGWMMRYPWHKVIGWALWHSFMEPLEDGNKQWFFWPGFDDEDEYTDEPGITTGVSVSDPTGEKPLSVTFQDYRWP